VNVRKDGEKRAGKTTEASALRLTSENVPERCCTSATRATRILRRGRGIGLTAYRLLKRRIAGS